MADDRAVGVPELRESILRSDVDSDGTLPRVRRRADKPERSNGSKGTRMRRRGADSPNRALTLKGFAPNC